MKRISKRTNKMSVEAYACSCNTACDCGICMCYIDDVAQLVSNGIVIQDLEADGSTAYSFFNIYHMW